MANIKDSILKNNTDIETLKATAKDLAKQLKQAAPKRRKAVRFIKAKHSAKTNEVIEKLNKLQLENNKTKFIHEFCDLIYAYAGYLDKNHSKRTLNLLRDIFSGYELFYKGEITELPTELPKISPA